MIKMNVKALTTLFFLFNLFGLIPIILAACNIYKEPIQNNMSLFTILLAIGVVGTFVMRKVETKITEREMKNFNKN